MMNYAFCCVLNMIRVSLFCMENWCPSLRLAFFYDLLGFVSSSNSFLLFDL
ncbi:hypothetical protein Hanom_Chr11g01007741 [Helianthus anomalus]